MNLSSLPKRYQALAWMRCAQCGTSYAEAVKDQNIINLFRFSKTREDKISPGFWYKVYRAEEKSDLPTLPYDEEEIDRMLSEHKREMKRINRRVNYHKKKAKNGN